MRSQTTTEVGRGDRPRRRGWWVIPAALLVLWLVGVGPLGSLIGQLASVQKNDNASFLPESTESTQVQRQATQFLPANVLPAIVVYERQAGLSEADLTAIQADVAWIKTLPSLRRPVRQAHRGSRHRGMADARR